MDSGIDIAKGRKFLEDRDRSETASNLELHEKASHDAENIVKMIVECYHPSRIMFWGSLLDSEIFDSNSDIDIAIVC